LTTYVKERPLTEIEELKKLIPDFDKTPLKMKSSTKGEIIELTTDNTPLQTAIKSLGFRDKSAGKIEIITTTLTTKIKNLFNV